MRSYSLWLVRYYKLTESIDLPQLETIKLGERSFYITNWIRFESNETMAYVIQICQTFDPLNLIAMQFAVMTVMRRRKDTTMIMN